LVKGSKKINKDTANNLKNELKNQYKNGDETNQTVPFIQNLTNITGAITKIESRTPAAIFGSGGIRSITNKDIITNKPLDLVELTFTDPQIFNETMRKYRATTEVIDNYGRHAGRTWGNAVLFPKEKTQFLITFDSSKIPENYNPEKHPPPLQRGGRRKSRKVQKKRYSRRIASRKYRNRK